MNNKILKVMLNVSRKFRVISIGTDFFYLYQGPVCIPFYLKTSETNVLQVVCSRLREQHFHGICLEKLANMPTVQHCQIC